MRWGCDRLGLDMCLLFSGISGKHREAEVWPCVPSHGAIRGRNLATPLLPPLLVVVVGAAACWQRTIAHPWLKIQPHPRYTKAGDHTCFTCIPRVLRY